MTSDAPAPAPPPAAERLVATEHCLRLAGGATLDVTAACGTLVLREEAQSRDGVREAAKARAQLFFIAYTARDAPPGRPITFAFNGGPGSSSVWLHLGLLGPWRVALDCDGRSRPPHALEDNVHTLLAVSDVVFIDPVGTGHSRVAEGEKVAEFHDYRRDLDAVGEFIRLYLTRHARWGSPKYLIGESYGTTRAAGLSRHLQERHDIDLDGLMLVSMAVDLQTLSFDHGNELPYALFVGAYAATAWYHRALAPELQARPVLEVVADAERFAIGDYTVALMHGDRLDGAARERVAAQLARWTGLAAPYVLRCDLRPTPERYFKELLRERGLTVGRLDTRYTAMDRDDAGEHAESDASHDALAGAFAAGIHRVLHDKLDWRDDAPYLVLARLWEQWGWKDFANRYVNVGDALRRAMHANPHLRVYVAGGLYDGGTPPAAGDYTLAHLGLRAALRERIRVSRFEAGHMMYVHAASFERLARELKAFVGGA